MSATAPTSPSPTPAATHFGRKLSLSLGMIKLAHTIFAMPFAIMGWAFGVATVREVGLVAPELGNLSARALPPMARSLGLARMPWVWTLAWVVVAMVGARSFAMAVNRIMDRRIDAANPRTAQRELARGALSPAFAWGFALSAAALFIGACAMLNQRTLVLAPVALVIVGGYSLTKRWTVLCHGILGLGLALAPIGGWLAATGGPFQFARGVPYQPFGIPLFGTPAGSGTTSLLDTLPDLLAFSPTVSALALGVLLWVAGFDIIYALQDLEYDRRAKLHSIPAWLGVRRSLVVARGLHLAAWLCWLLAVISFAYSSGIFLDQLGYATPGEYEAQHALGTLSGIGLALVACGLIYEHSLVKHDDLSKIDAAFFTINGIISIAFGTLVVLDVFI